MATVSPLIFFFFWKKINYLNLFIKKNKNNFDIRLKAQINTIIILNLSLKNNVKLYYYVFKG